MLNILFTLQPHLLPKPKSATHAYIKKKLFKTNSLVFAGSMLPFSKLFAVNKRTVDCTNTFNCIDLRSSLYDYAVFSESWGNGVPYSNGSLPDVKYLNDEGYCTTQCSCVAPSQSVCLTYMAIRAAIFFQMILNSMAGSLSPSIFNDCANSRYISKVSGVCGIRHSNDFNCSNTDDSCP